MLLDPIDYDPIDYDLIDYDLIDYRPVAPPVFAFIAFIHRLHRFNRGFCPGVFCPGEGHPFAAEFDAGLGWQYL
ncbi:MAG: hypothetical protein ACRD20_16600 [Terriglobales bacterium]